MTSKNISISLLLLLATGLSIWSILVSTAVPTTHELTNPKEADSFMQDVVATVLNSDGAPTMKLITPKMIHYPENNTTRIFTPRVTLFRKSPKPWYVDADYATASHGIDEILFWSNVNIHHPADEENPNTTLQTDTLKVFPAAQVATTDKPVTFIQPDTIVHGIGMLANLDAGTIKLLSQANGEYAPTS